MARASLAWIGHNATSSFDIDRMTLPQHFSEQVDVDLLAACRTGSSDAYDVFFRRHREPLLAYFARRTASPETAADLMAETFAQALATVARGTTPLPSVPVAWLFTIARNLLVDALRRGKVDSAARRSLALEPLVLEPDDLDRIAEIADAADYVRHLARLMPESEFALLHARLVDETPYADLATQLQCSESVVRKRVSRAKARLRAAVSAKKHAHPQHDPA